LFRLYNIIYENKNIFTNNNLDDFIIYQGFAGTEASLSSNVILPSFSYLEKNIITLNIFNNVQIGKKGLSHILNSQNDIFIFVVLGFFLNKKFTFFSKFYLFKRLCEISPIFIKNSFFNLKKFTINFNNNLTKYNLYFQNSIFLLSINCFYRNSFNLGVYSKNLLEIIKTKSSKHTYIIK